MYGLHALLSGSYSACIPYSENFHKNVHEFNVFYPCDFTNKDFPLWDMYHASLYHLLLIFLLDVPFTHRLLINFTNETGTSWTGYFYAVLLFVAAVFQSLLSHQYFHACFRVGMNIRTAIIAAVYGKVVDRDSYNLLL